MSGGIPVRQHCQQEYLLTRGEILNGDGLVTNALLRPQRSYFAGEPVFDFTISPSRSGFASTRSK